MGAAKVPGEGFKAQPAVPQEAIGAYGSQLDNRYPNKGGVNE
ncbi:protein of unknown function [Candidatus Methylocalor cossyra]|uniref:Uncharacterized protein n=1 Tax=Candidatus Methylocalor cossyra TaxID=3108543 RepID=A0ABM9NHF7_9GAMM